MRVGRRECKNKSYARRKPRRLFFGRGFDSRHLHHRKSRNFKEFRDFFMSLNTFSLMFSLIRFSFLQAGDKALHPLGTGLLHLVGDVAVHIQGKGGGVVAKVFLHRLDVVTALDGDNGVGMT